MTKEDEVEIKDDDSQDSDDSEVPQSKPSCWDKIPCYNNFQQQTCPYVSPIVTPLPLGIAFFLLGCILLLVGVALLLITFDSHTSKVYRYDNLCSIGSKCTFIFELEEDFEKPVYLYYQLDRFYQNHRRYYQSRSDLQLRSVITNDYDELIVDCFPAASEDDVDDRKKVYLPCGLQSISFFNDTFTLKKLNGKHVDQSSSDIAWPSDAGNVFKDPGASTVGIRVVADYEDPNFIVWMRPAALPRFFKLYAEIDEDLDKGLYKMEIKNFYPVDGFDGQKFFKLATVTGIGGRNILLGGSYLVAGGILIFIGFIFCAKRFFLRRKLGDTSYLNWKPMS